MSLISPQATPDLIAAAADGHLYLLTDLQYAWWDDRRFVYHRVAVQVTDRAGLETVASIVRYFDPEFSTPPLLTLDVIRDGKVMSYRDTLREEIYRRETQLEAGIIDGTLTAHLQVPDLRVGDIVDVAVLFDTIPLTSMGNQSVYQQLEYSIPVALARSVVAWPADRPLHIAPVPERVAFERTDLDNVIRLEWQREHNIPTTLEPSIPIQERPYATVQISSFENWGQVSSELTE